MLLAAELFDTEYIFRTTSECPFVLYEYADALIAFWDGNSRGTKHMIDLAKRYDLKIKIIKYEY
jgi:hypothetical protein